ncbi:Rieske (2Fe-2S) protein [Sphingomonas crusticola]|uniref:Rieske (2Fe-2S) protein n=1 Tax=Sphingomonas crusticola TaxID=1697973 RepID=UPI000E233DB7|nr:Rieske (2Fe-2S) protein [Sphingomonas crusticola]
MTDAERLTEAPPGVRLAAFADIPDGTARNFVLQMKAGRFHGFIVRKGDRIFGYRDRCPHAGLPLAQELDRYLTPDGSLIACSWHGALFDIASGRCVGGPCAGSVLPAWSVTVTDGWIVTA